MENLTAALYVCALQAGISNSVLWKVSEQEGGLIRYLGEPKYKWLQLRCDENAYNKFMLASNKAENSPILQDWLKQANHHITTLEDTNYPELLKKIHNPPAVLFIAGNLQIVNNPQIAIVGSRKCTVMNREISEDFAFNLAQCGITITSGLALGIDAFAHQGALKAGGATIAVMGCGLNQTYPKSHQKLRAHIEQQNGAVISEFLPSSPPIAYNFPRRNRIISGLSLGVLVVQADTKSGSLITARLALEQNREVFAIPGSIRNPAHRGCHYLIKQGAQLVENLDDIWAALPQLKPSKKINITIDCDKKSALFSTNANSLLQILEDYPMGVDQIINLSKLSAEVVNAALVELQIAGKVENIAGSFQKK